uniref:DUF4062 domain-containing protein n=1 Tax=Chlorobium chlorochromatii (strain CaD3) TaxID=340177 RepID=Q3APW6_CHLCH
MQRIIRIFFASPGDLEEERHLTKEILRQMSERSRYTFEFYGFERALATTACRPQDVINNFVDECDVFIAVFHRRWGQPPQDTVVYSSYTEEEFERAKRRFVSTGAPEIFCFFKQVDLPSIADPGEQLRKVLAFKRRLEESHQVLYRTFATAAQFVADIEQHLFAFAEGKLPTPRSPKHRFHIPIIEDQQPDSQRSYDLTKVHQALNAATSGCVEEAVILMAGVSQTTRDIELLDVIKEFFINTNNLDAAQAVVEKKLTLLQDRRLAAHAYVAVLMSEHWLNDLVASMSKTVSPEKQSVAEHTTRKLFTGIRFHELMIEYLSKYFTVGELLSLTRFYQGEGASITAKFGRTIGIMIPEINAILMAENPELFEG